MNRSDRLQRLANIQESSKHIAGAGLAKAQEQYRRDLRQLEQLKLYRGDYRERLNRLMQQGIGASEMQDFRYFFSTLENAINQQQMQLEHSTKQLERLRQHWQQQQQEVDKLQKASQRALEQETFIQLELEQFESDERSQQRPQI